MHDFNASEFDPRSIYDDSGDTLDYGPLPAIFLFGAIAIVYILIGLLIGWGIWG
jgi:hypothetical protein